MGVAHCPWHGRGEGRVRGAREKQGNNGRHGEAGQDLRRDSREGCEARQKSREDREASHRHRLRRKEEEKERPSCQEGGNPLLLRLGRNQEKEEDNNERSTGGTG